VHSADPSRNGSGGGGSFGGGVGGGGGKMVSNPSSPLQTKKVLQESVIFVGPKSPKMSKKALTPNAAREKGEPSVPHVLSFKRANSSFLKPIHSHRVDG
jgi:hypothetical protein